MTPNEWRLERRFYIGMAIVSAAIAIAGFGPAIVDTASRTAPMTLAVAAHGVLFAAWLLLFLTQTVLVSTGRVAIHRQLGYLGAALAVLMVTTGFQTAIAMGRRRYDLSGDLISKGEEPYITFALQLGALVIFSVLVAAAIWNRRRREVHKRLMLLATVGGLLPAALAHIIGHSDALRQVKAPIILIPIVALLSAGMIYDKRSTGRVHRVSVWGGVSVFVFLNVLAAVVGPSESWRRFTEWLTR